MRSGFLSLCMIATLHHSLLAIALITLLELAVIARILLRPHRDPASRIAWTASESRSNARRQSRSTLSDLARSGRKASGRAWAQSKQSGGLPTTEALVSLAVPIPEGCRVL